MISDRAKDRAEDSVATAVEALVSIVPFAGGPAAVIVNRAFGSAVQRRNETIMAGFESDIQRLMERHEKLEADRWPDSEPFMAALHTTFRAAQETASDEKRKLLRNALINGYVLSEDETASNGFLALILKYDPDHVLILETLVDIMANRTTMMDSAASAVYSRLRPQMTPTQVGLRIDELVRDGLISESRERKIEEIHTRGVDKQVVRETAWHSPSDRGEAFLAFVADPIAEAPGVHAKK
jgi:hypothetical protein